MKYLMIVLEYDIKITPNSYDINYEVDILLASNRQQTLLGETVHTKALKT